MDGLLHHENKISKSQIQSLQNWIEEIYPHIGETHQAGLTIDHTLHVLSMLYQKHPECQRTINEYLAEGGDLRIKLIDESLIHMQQFSTAQFSNVLKSFNILNIVPHEEWIEAWENRSIELFDQFESVDFINNLHSYLSLETNHKKEWMDLFFEKIEKHIDYMSSDNFSKLTRLIAKSSYIPPARLTNKWKKNSDQFSSHIEAKDLAHHISFLQKSKNLNENSFETFINHFDKLIETESLLYIMKCFKSASNTIYKIKKETIIKIEQKLQAHKEEWSLQIFGRFLISCALQDISIKKRFPELLLKIQQFLKKNPLTTAESQDTCYNIMLAHHYFLKMKNCDLGIIIEDEHFVELYIKETRDKITTAVQKEVFEFFLENNEAHLEVWIPEILNFVDIYIPKSKSIIEVNGLSHYQNNQLTPKSNLKTNLLLAYDYNVINVDVRHKNKEDWIFECIAPEK